MKLADLLPCQLVGLGGAHRRFHHAVENVPVKPRRSGFALWFDVFGHKPVG